METQLEMLEEKMIIASQPDADRATVARFISLAVRGLGAMFDAQTQLFCFKLKKSENGMVSEGLSHRYTTMTLMGLHRLQRSGGRSPFDADRILVSLLSDLNWIDNLGDLGVMLWMCSVVCPEKLPTLESRIQLETALDRYKDASQGITMHLAWFLTGMSCWALAYPEKVAKFEAIAFKTYDLLSKNQGARGFFGHLSTSGSLNGFIRGRIGSFADQVYPIYGMAHFAKAYQHDKAAERALKCAVGICEEQGPKGQWWWHYDAPGGRVADGYPVFSVHQHAMAPFTLFEAGEILQRNFEASIYKGLRWINSNNELGCDMEDPANGVIWRCIFRSQRSLARYLKAGLGVYADPVEQRSPDGLEVKYECRPYELGWLLYAFANRTL